MIDTTLDINSVFAISPEQASKVQQWLIINCGPLNRAWTAQRMVQGGMATGFSVTFCERKHKRMFDLYMLLCGISVYSSVEDLNLGRLRKWQNSISWSPE